MPVNYLNPAINLRQKGIKLAKSQGHKIWNPQEDDLLVSLYRQGSTYKQIAEQLGRSVSAVHGRVKRRFLSDRLLNDDLDRYIRNHYSDMSTSDIAERLGKSIRTIQRRAKNMGLVNSYIFGENHHCSKLSDHDVELIRILHDEGLTFVELADKFEVSAYHVRDIVNFRYRKTLSLH